MKAAFVVQRFGDDVIGGAESHALWLAEKLVREKGWSLDVFNHRKGLQNLETSLSSGAKRHQGGSCLQV